MRTLEKELREANALLETKAKQINDLSICVKDPDVSKAGLNGRIPCDSDDDIVLDDVYRLLSRTEVMNGSFLGSSSGRAFYGIILPAAFTNSKNYSNDDCK